MDESYPGVTNIEEACMEYARLMRADDLGGESEQRLLRLWPGAESTTFEQAKIIYEKAKTRGFRTEDRREQLAEQWRAGGWSAEDALERLNQMIKSQSRFDARDRYALAYILRAIEQKALL